MARGDPQADRRFDIWTRDLARSSESRITFAGNNRYPVWSADGSHLFFVSDRDGTDKVYQKAANDTGPEELVEAAFKLPMDASRDGRYLLTVTPGDNPKTGNDIWVLPLLGDRKPSPYVQTEFRENRPRLSPDTHWLAYQSNKSKRDEVYVMSFPQPGQRLQVSSNGGQIPAWSNDGRELYYYSPEGKIMEADVKPGVQFQFGPPRPLFEAHISLFVTVQVVKSVAGAGKEQERENDGSRLRQ